MISAAFERHERAVLSFSGGKDSLAVLHQLRPYADRTTVIFVDMGDMFPHVIPFVEQVCAAWGFPLQIVRSAPPENVLPSDMVPIWSTPFADAFLPERSRPGQVLVSGLDCCNHTLWMPLHQAIQESGTTLVFRGSKGTDEHISVPSGTVRDGIEYLNPLETWTDDEVYAYLEFHTVALPFQYRAGCNHSLDCMGCTAWLATPAEVQRVEFTRDYYPEAFTRLQERMARVASEIYRRSEDLGPAMGVLLGG